MQEAAWHMVNSNIGGLQGEANIVTVGDQVVMIDTGQRRSADVVMLKYLSRLSVEKVDHLFISEANRSHFGGIVSLIKAGIPINNIYYLKGLEESFELPRKKKRFFKHLKFAEENGSKIHAIEPGFELPLSVDSSISIPRVIPPSAERSEMPFAVSTMLIRFNVGGSGVLFSGDIDREYAEYLIEEVKDDPSKKSILSADYFKLPQTGTNDPAPEAFYDLIDAKYLFIPSPKRRWCFGEGAIARNWTFLKGLPTWITGSNGNIRVTWKPDHTMILPQYISGQCKLKEFGSLMVRD